MTPPPPLPTLAIKIPPPMIAAHEGGNTTALAGVVGEGLQCRGGSLCSEGEGPFFTVVGVPSAVLRARVRERGTNALILPPIGVNRNFFYSFLHLPV